MRNLAFYVVFISMFFWIFATFCYSEEINAPAAVVVDAQTGEILYGKNPHLKLPPASTTKLVTAIIALEKLSPDYRVTISAKAANTPSVSPKLKEGEVYTVRDLIHLALMRSVNSAAVALAEAVAGSEENFVKIMNEKVYKMGAKNTKLANASGLPGGDQYITAYDLTKIMSHSLAYPLIREAIQTRVHIVYSENGSEHFIQNTNQLLWTEDNIIGGKTGYTKTARHCFVSAARINNRLVYVALLGVPNRDKLWEDTKILLTKAESVISGKDEPIVMYTNEKPIVKAHYKKIKFADKKKQIVKTKEKILVKKDVKTKKVKNKNSNQKRVKNARINQRSI